MHNMQHCGFCPTCGSLDLNLISEGLFYAVECQSCLILGPRRPKPSKACAAWNSLPRMQGLQMLKDHTDLFKEMEIRRPSEQRCRLCKISYIEKDGWLSPQCTCKGLVEVNPEKLHRKIAAQV